MNRFLAIFLVVIFLISCQKNKKSSKVPTVIIEQADSTQSSIRAIHAVDSKTVYYADSKGYIGKTTDGGKTWQRQQIRYNDSINPHFRSIAVVDHKVFALSVANPALLYKVENDSVQLVYKEEHPKVFYDAMKFFSNGKDGIAVGDPTTTCPSLLITHDGGVTWSKTPCEALPTFEEGEAFFAASNTNIKIVGDTVWIASGGKKARVLRSIDRGNTWSIMTTPIIQGNGPQGIYSIDFYDALHGCIIGGDYSKPDANTANKAITDDGGQTWKLVADKQHPNYKSCVQYLPGSDGLELIAIGKTGISYSNDGGTHWKSISNEAFYTLQFVSKTTAWVAGANRIARIQLSF